MFTNPFLIFCFFKDSTIEVSTRDNYWIEYLIFLVERKIKNYGSILKKCLQFLLIPFNNSIT